MEPGKDRTSISPDKHFLLAEDLGARHIPDLEDQKYYLLQMAKIALERYGFKDAKIILLHGDERKRFFHVTSSEKREFALRSYRLSYARWDRSLTSEAALRSQALWVKSLKEAELRVPEPILTTDGAMISAVSVAGLDRLRICLLQRWTPGRHKTPEQFEPNDLHSLGSYIARMHNHSERYFPPEGFLRPRWGWPQIFGGLTPLWREGKKFYSAGDMATIYATSRKVLRILQGLGKGPEVFGLIHRDLNTSNIVFHEREASAVDFDSCGWGYYLYDLSQVLLELDLGTRFPEFLNALIEGYRSKRLLPTNYPELLEAFVAMRRVSKINFMLGKNMRNDDQRSPKLPPKSVERLEEFVSDETGPGNYLRYRLSLLRTEILEPRARR